MTKAQLRARLAQILAETPEPPQREWPRNAVEPIGSGGELIAGVRSGRLIVVTRPVAQELLHHLRPLKT